MMEKSENEDVGLQEDSPIIKIDRGAPLIYPNSMRPLFPELEKNGPTEFDASGLMQVASIRDSTTNVCKFLREIGMIENCPGFAEILAIKDKRVDFFNKHLRGKIIFGHKGAVTCSDGHTRVPYIHEYQGDIVLGWYGTIDHHTVWVIMGC